jgi:hypothetical protein
VVDLASNAPRLRRAALPALELTVGSSSKEKPTVARVLTMAFHSFSQNGQEKR